VTFFVVSSEASEKNVLSKVEQVRKALNGTVAG
jgi:hypothetical protein